MQMTQPNHKDKKTEPLQKDSAQSLFKIRSCVKVGALDLSAFTLDNLSHSSGTLDQTLQEDAFKEW